MSVITIFSASFCEAEAVAGGVAEKLGYSVAGDEILEAASRDHKMPVEKLQRAMHGQPSIFNSYSREKERCTVFLQEALSRTVRGDNVVIHGFAVQLLPTTLSHVLKVCLVADREHRIKTAAMGGGAGGKKEALRLIKKDDTETAQWVQFVHSTGPWDEKLYDMKLPMHKMSVDEAVAMICENAGKNALQTTELSLSAADDFVLASRVRVALAMAGHYVQVECGDSEVTMIIDKHVIRLEHLSQDLIKIAKGVDGVKEATTKVGPNFHEANIYRRQNFELPSRVLLVDDEKEYVQTLSERLQMRDFGTAVASDGEQALAMVKEDEPEVMVLDLRMPGIDGMEVLDRMKKENPGVEVIILTGHGTDKDRETAMNLGAFAYLEKPVDIELLSRTMKEAYEKARRDKEEL